MSLVLVGDAGEMEDDALVEMEISHQGETREWWPKTIFNDGCPTPLFDARRRSASFEDTDRMAGSDIDREAP